MCIYIWEKIKIWRPPPSDFYQKVHLLNCGFFFYLRSWSPPLLDFFHFLWHFFFECFPKNLGSPLLSKSPHLELWTFFSALIPRLLDFFHFLWHFFNSEVRDYPTHFHSGDEGRKIPPPPTQHEPLPTTHYHQPTQYPLLITHHNPPNHPQQITYQTQHTHTHKA